MNLVSTSQTTLAKIFWETNVPTNASLSFWKGEELMNVLSIPSFNTQQEIILSKLSPRTTYQYILIVCSQGGYCTQDTEKSFTTKRIRSGGSSNSTTQEEKQIIEEQTLQEDNTTTQEETEELLEQEEVNDERTLEDRLMPEPVVIDKQSEHRFSLSSGRGSHRITIKEILEEEEQVTIYVESEVQEVTLRVGETKYVDVTRDGGYDIVVTLLSITGSTINLVVKDYVQETIANPQEQQDFVEQKQEISEVITTVDEKDADTPSSYLPTLHNPHNLFVPALIFVLVFVIATFFIIRKK